MIIIGYPTPHVDSDSPETDIHFLAQKVHAGAHFIITQLFYDVDGFLDWVKRVRAAGEHKLYMISVATRLHGRRLVSRDRRADHSRNHADPKLCVL